MATFDVAVLILRLGIGLTFAGHGAQKAFGWWGGPGLERWQGAIGSMGFRPAYLFALVSTLAELLGGLLLAIGLLTPFAAAVLIAQSVVIVLHVHWAKGFWNARGGIEFPLSLAAATLAIGLLGAGGISVDAALGLAYTSALEVGLVVLGIVAGLVSVAIPHLVAREESGARAS